MAKKEAITRDEVDEFKIVKPNKFTAKIFDVKVSRILKMVEIEILNSNKLNEIRNLLLSKLAIIEN